MSTPSAAPASDSPRLVYAPPPPWHRRRKFRRVAGILLVLTAVIAGWRYGKAAWIRGRFLYVQHKCLNYTAPPEQVVFEQDPARVAALLGQSGYVNPAAAGVPSEAAWVPGCWPEMCRMPAGFPPGSRPGVGSGAGAGGAMLFLHELRSPGGQRRLLAVRLSRGLPLGPVLEDTLPDLILLAPASLTAPPKVLNPAIVADFDLRLPVNPSGRRYRCYAGQVDPSDASHFTLRYLADDVPGTVDGWLRDDDRIELQVRCAAPPGRPVNELFCRFKYDPRTGLYSNSIRTQSEAAPAAPEPATAPAGQ